MIYNVSNLNAVEQCSIAFNPSLLICKGSKKHSGLNRCPRYDLCNAIHNCSSWGISCSDVMFLNRYGYYRRFPVYSAFLCNDITLDRVVDLYKKWRDDAEYIGLRGLDVVENDYVYSFVKCAKRGNDVYRYLIYEKFKPLLNLDNVTSVVSGKTNLLFVTLTWDTKQDTCDLKTAWSDISKDVNRFRSNLINNFGHVEIFKVIESTKQGFPHIHMLIWFDDFSFNVFKHKNKDGKISLRIPKKHGNTISGFWHSWVDIQGVNDVAKSVREISKYVTKDLCCEKGDLTNALLWVFGKQSYSISSGFKEKVLGLCCDVSEPKVHDLTREMCNSKPNVVKWELMGIYGGREMGIHKEIWFVNDNKPPPFVLIRAKKEGYL